MFTNQRIARGLFLIKSQSKQVTLKIKFKHPFYLRDLFGDHGLLRFDIVAPSQKPYMPFEKDSAMECRRNISLDNPIRCFLAGDGRANEQVWTFISLCFLKTTKNTEHIGHFY